MNNTQAMLHVPAPPLVLVIEFNPIMRKMLGQSLEQAGYNVLAAADGGSAVALMANHLPDLVIQNLLLPDLHYTDLIDRLRALPGGEQTPIVALSGLIDQFEQAELLATGFTDVLFKPIEPSRLVQAVRFHLPPFGQPVGDLGRGRRVLVADDDPIQRKLLTIRLSQIGFEVVTVEDGEAALSELLRDPPAAVVSDILMPRLDGFGLCRAVRNTPMLADMPLVLVSASYNEYDDRALALKVGASAFVVPTPDFQELIDALLASLSAKLPPHTVDTGEALSKEHVQRVVRQIERQANANAALAQGSAIQAAQLAILAGVSDILTSNLDIEQVLDEVLARCLDGAGTSTGAVYLVEPDGRLVPRTQIGYPAAMQPLLADFFGHSNLLALALESGVPLGVPSAQVPDPIARDLLEQSRAGSLLITPLIAGQEALGVVVMVSNYRDLEDDWVIFAKAIGYQISQAIALGRTVARLATSEQRFRNLVQEVDAIVWELEVATERFTFVSRRAEDILGYPVEQWYSEPDFWINHVHPDDRAQADALWHAAVTEGKEYTAEYRVVAANGRIVWLRDTMHVVLDARGQVARQRGLMIDITEQKRLEEQFHQSQKMEAVGRLAGGVAHDFNNLLTAITGYSEFLLNDFEPADPHWDDVNQIKQAAERAARLTRQLLAFSRRQILAPQVLDLNEVVTSMQTMLRRLIGEDIDLALRLDPALEPIKADPGQIEQVILNLIINARDAMPRGGRITIETSRSQLDPARAYPNWYTIVAPGPCVALSVSDTGIGMDEQVRAQIFEPFFTTKEQGKGTGLGLSTVYGIVRQSGGDIFVDSQPGDGAVFTIYLPAINPAVEPAQPHEPFSLHALHAGGSETVLLVEDEEDVRALVGKILQRNGYTVLGARDGDQALEIAAGYAGPIHLLLTDVVMPGMSGYDLAKQLLGRRAEMHVLYVSGYTDNAIVHHLIQGASATYLQKPFTPAALALMVRQILDNRPGRSPAALSTH